MLKTSITSKTYKYGGALAIRSNHFQIVYVTRPFQAEGDSGRNPQVKDCTSEHFYAPSGANVFGLGSAFWRVPRFPPPLPTDQSQLHNNMAEKVPKTEIPKFWGKNNNVTMPMEIQKLTNCYRTTIVV